MKGVDVSIYNHPVSWQELKSAGISFAICRTGYGKNGVDETFARYVHDAHAAGLICGAYHYSYALNLRDARAEAKACKEIISRAGCLLELPVFFDMEDADGYKKNHGFNFSKENVTKICAEFLEEIKPLNAGIYASYSWLEDLIDWKSLNCPVWNAQYYREDFFKGYMWQYTDSCFIGGKPFDMNWLYDL